MLLLFKSRGDVVKGFTSSNKKARFIFHKQNPRWIRKLKPIRLTDDWDSL